MESNKENVEKVLEENIECIFPIQGKSMMPLFRQKKDCVVITKPKDTNFRKYDIVLYRFNEKLILHRIIKITNEGLIIKGDNTFINEYVKPNEVIGIVKSYYRGKKLVSLETKSQSFYIHFWRLIYPIRFVFYKFKRFVRKYIWKK